MRTTIIAIFFAILIYASYKKLIDIQLTYVIMFGLFALILTYNNEEFEHLTDSQAIQNCASIVNGGNATITTLNITGKLNMIGSDGITNVLTIDNNGVLNVIGLDGKTPVITTNRDGFIKTAVGGQFANAFIGNASVPSLTWGTTPSSPPGSMVGMTHISFVNLDPKSTSPYMFYGTNGITSLSTVQGLLRKEAIYIKGDKVANVKNGNFPGSTAFVCPQANANYYTGNY